MLEGALIGGLIGAGVGMVIYIIIYVAKAAAKRGKINSNFYIVKGMTYEQVVKAIGEPRYKAQSGEKLDCFWDLQQEGKEFKIRVVFENNTVVKVG